MTPADDVEGIARRSPLWARYGERIDPESARELLAGRLAEPEPGAAPESEPEPEPEAPVRVPAPPRRRRAPAPARSTPEAIGDFLTSRQGRRLQKQVVRGVFGMLRKRL
jgi:hypothetical protein